MSTKKANVIKIEDLNQATLGDLSDDELWLLLFHRTMQHPTIEPVVRMLLDRMGRADLLEVYIEMRCDDAERRMREIMDTLDERESSR